MTILMHLHLALFLASSTAAASADEPAKIPARGDKVTLTATFGQVPCLDNEAAYKAYCAATKAATPNAVNAIKRMYGQTLRLIPSGTEVEIVEATAGPKLSTVTSPTSVPHLIVKRLGTEGSVYVPAFYLRLEDGKAFPIEAKFPVLSPIMVHVLNPEPGREMFIHKPGGGDSWSATDIVSFRDLIKALAAQDQIGVDALVKAKDAVVAPSGSKILVIEIKKYSDVNGIVPVEVRFLDGPLKGTSSCVIFQHLATSELEVVSFQTASRASGVPAKKKVGR
jgi:hypothetical protein